MAETSSIENFGKIKVSASIEVYGKNATLANFRNDAAKSATLLSQHRAGGFHRPMHASRSADCRTSGGFAKSPPGSKLPEETSQSRRHVVRQLKPKLSSNETIRNNETAFIYYF